MGPVGFLMRCSTAANNPVAGSVSHFGLLYEWTETLPYKCCCWISKPLWFVDITIQKKPVTCMNLFNRPRKPTAFYTPRGGFQRAADGVTVCKEKSNFVD